MQELGVSGKAVDDVVGTLMQHDIHAKLTGAGGDGGCVIGFYIPGSVSEETLTEVRQTLEKQGCTVMDESKTKVETRGLHIS